MTDRSKKILKLFLRITITSVLLVWVFCNINLQQLAEAIRTARWRFLIVVWALIVVIYWVEAMKMRLILKKQGCVINAATVFRASAVSALYSMVMPGMLSMGVKWYILKKSTGKGTNVFSSMAYNQFTSIVTMMVFGLGALILTNPAAIASTDAKNGYMLQVFWNFAGGDCSFLPVIVK